MEKLLYIEAKKVWNYLILTNKIVEKYMKKIEFENILEDFEFLENWEDKYRYIIDLGKELESYPEDLKN